MIKVASNQLFFTYIASLILSLIIHNKAYADPYLERFTKEVNESFRGCNEARIATETIDGITTRKIKIFFDMARYIDKVNVYNQEGILIGFEINSSDEAVTRFIIDEGPKVGNVNQYYCEAATRGNEMRILSENTVSINLEDDNESIVCRERFNFMRTILNQNKTTVDSTIEEISKMSIDVVLLGERHNVPDYKRDQISFITKYKKTSDSFDCYLKESRPKLIEEGLYEYLFDKYGSTQNNLRGLVKQYADEKELELQNWGVDNFAIITDNVNEEMISTYRNVEFFATNKIKIYRVDERKIDDRDAAMANYIKNLFLRNKCTKAVMVTGNGHLRPLKKRLNNLNISNFTIKQHSKYGFHNYVSIPFWGERLLFTQGLFNFVNCSFADLNMPQNDFIIRTHNDWGLPLIFNDPFEYSWGEFDALYITDVDETEVTPINRVGGLSGEDRSVLLP